AAGGEEVAPHPLARQVLPGRRKFGRDLRPVALELLGDELGEAGHGALAHLGAGDADDDGVVRADHHPGGDLRRAVGGTHYLRPDRDVEPEREAPAERGGAHHEGATIDLRNVIHVGLPYALTAAWIAARTCWKV